MSLPHLPGNRYVLNLRTFPEGDLQVNFTWHDDACRFLMDQAFLYAGRVTSFHACLAEHTDADWRRILHEVHWKADADEHGLQAFVDDTIRADLARQLLNGLDHGLIRAGVASKVVYAEWQWVATGDGCHLDDLPALVRLADGGNLTDFYDLLDSSLYDVADRYFVQNLFGLSTDQPLAVRRERNGAITTSADPDFACEPILKATA
ncbi:hypothetical protein M3C36_06460 [Dietzia cinnamea]|uniref:hypothetical protein n=1 Tax=Dietzia cinnamea TaxID=321318 RepID=UPI0021A6C19A|nr:hypothetical protein [Dietzia cinnamea]MCT1884828.1 hypothetical protein [Dietzia cinnamea]